MKDRSKEKIAELLMDELLTRLSERGTLKRMLGEMTEHPIEQLVNDLVSDFEKVVERYAAVSVSQPPVTSSETAARPAVLQEPAPPVIEKPDLPAIEEPDLPAIEEPDLPAIEEPDPPVATGIPRKPVQPELSDTEVGESEIVKAKVPKQADPDPPQEPDHEEVVEQPDARSPVKEVSDFRSRLEELARRVENEYLEKLEREGVRPGPEDAVPQPTSRDRSTDEGAHPPPEPEQKTEKEEPKRPIDVGPGEGGRPSRILFRTDDNEYLYIHGVMSLPPGESPCEYPFMLEEKGVDGKEFAFAVDAEDLRFFLSKINQKEMNVSRKGILLLGKAESLQLHGVHQSILNELRAHGIVLPMEFGTVARGKTALLELASRFREPIAEALEKLAASRWWTVTMSVLDGRIAQLFAEEGEQRGERDGRERARVSYSSAVNQTKKYDVKLLEKLLQKEKRLAESVHQELSSKAERSEIQHMVGLGSGTSDDWKLILQATYLVSGLAGFQRLSRSVTDLQYRHILFEPMLSVTGDVQDFSFLRN
ncbi:MAG: GvpL/GvpF family gas vesicle protein [Ignavibacteria bacterium]|nr:GvpL/GvpF family gas vesicle protein [Ignavibacteria bacterium]